MRGPSDVPSVSDLRSFSLDDLYRCSAELRRIGERARDADEAAAQVVSTLFEELKGREDGAPQCCLVRLFRTMPLRALSARDAAEAARALGAAASPDALCLSLRATRGIEPAWNDREASRRHRAIPLAPAPPFSNLPMVSALLEQLGVAGRLTATAPQDGRMLFDVFHVENARGSRLVPDQKDFVAPYGVASVLGFGGVLPEAQVFVVMLFSRVPISQATANLFRTMAASVGLGLARRDPTDTRLQAYEALVREHERIALAATHAKDDFLALLGHELRNPLAPILTAVDVMKLHGQRSREQEIIERHAVHLARLVNDLLEVSRIVRGKVEIHKSPLEIGAIVSRAVEMLSPALEHRRQRLVIDVPSRGLLVNADLGRMAQVVSNLLDNASKYSPVGSEIVVSASREDEIVKVRVRDQGIGIPRSKLETIFEPFAQQGRALDSNATGLGLGLSIVRGLVQRHHGTVRAQSEGPGKGAEITVELPLLTRPVACPAASASEEARPTPSRAKRVLVVDDNEDAADMVAETLSTLGHQVRVAYDGPGALRVARELEPEVVLLDIGLPVMDGYELAERLRSLPEVHEDTRFVAITGYGQEEDRERSRRARFAAHLVKPIPLEAISSAVEAS